MKTTTCTKTCAPYVGADTAVDAVAGDHRRPADVPTARTMPPCGSGAAGALQALATSAARTFRTALNPVRQTTADVQGRVVRLPRGTKVPTGVTGGDASSSSRSVPEPSRSWAGTWSRCSYSPAGDTAVDAEAGAGVAIFSLPVAVAVALAAGLGVAAQAAARLAGQQPRHRHAIPRRS